MSLNVFFSIIIAVVLGPLVTSFALAAPIFPEEAIREEALWSAPVEKQFIPVTIKNTGKMLESTFTIDTRDGLNGEEAALLAILINPAIEALRKKKGLPVPQLIQSGLLPPLRLLADEKAGPRSWLPSERLQLARKTVRAIPGASSRDLLDLESSWLEWQTFEAAKFYFYQNMKSRKAITLLRQIQKTYKDIYKATSEEKMRQKYPEQRATARLGYNKMKKSIKREQTELAAGRVGLDHALGLPTYVEVSLEKKKNFPLPAAVPAVRELTDKLNNRRIDFLALQKGITEKDAKLMRYIQSRFDGINIFVRAKTRAQWLDTEGAAIAISFPMFSSNMGIIGVFSADGKFLFKYHKRRMEMARENIRGLLQGIGILQGELGKIEKTMPILIKAAREAEGKGNALEALLAKKTLLAVRLLRLRSQGRLMDATIALEIASGTTFVNRHIP